MRPHRFLPFLTTVLGLLVQARLADAEQLQAPAAAVKSDEAVRDHARELMARAEFAEAKKEYESVVRMDESLYGPQDPKTLADRLALAIAQGKTGDSLKAEQEMRAQLVILNRRRGPDHIETLDCRMALARLLDDSGRSHEAVKEYRAILESRERLLGPDDLEVARVRHALGDALAGSQEYVEAIAEFRQAEVILERLLGAEHAETLLNRSNLALAEADHEEFATAAKDLKGILAIRERLLGPNDVSVFVTCFHLAHALGRLHQYDEALAYGTRAADGLKRTLAPSHYLVLQANQLCGELRTNQALLEPPKAKAAP